VDNKFKIPQELKILKDQYQVIKDTEAKGKGKGYGL